METRISCTTRRSADGAQSSDCSSPLSLILLTAYFGESPGGPLHTVQRGIVEVLSPIQEGASKALTPVRDVAGWVWRHVPRQVAASSAAEARTAS